MLLPLSLTHTLFQGKGEGIFQRKMREEVAPISLTHTLFQGKGEGVGSLLSLTYFFQRRVREGAPLSLSLSHTHFFRKR